VLVNCDHVSDRALYAVAANCRGLEELHLGGYRFGLGGLGARGTGSRQGAAAARRVHRSARWTCASRWRPPPPLPRPRSENITDGGLTVLLEACAGLRVLWLGGKLLKVTDATTAAAARHCAGALRRVKLTRSATAASLAALRGCRELEELDARHCRDDLPEALLTALLRACSNLRRVVLPPGPEADADADAAAAAAAGTPGRAVSGGGGSSCSVASGDDDDEEEEEGLARRGGGGPDGGPAGGGPAGGGAAAPGCSLSSARRGRMLGEGDLRRLLQGPGVSSH
jgi:hypothetical protein